MNRKKRAFSCCKPKKTAKRGKVLECKDVDEIVEALNCLQGTSKKYQMSKPPKFKTKEFKPRHYKDTCVPMVPSMHQRLKYIGHCPVEPAIGPDIKTKGMYRTFEFGSTSSSEAEVCPGILRRGPADKYRKRVRYYDLMPGDIMLPTPAPVIRHTDSNKSILNVASPSPSGEVIQAQRASVKPGELRPPLPAKSGHELFKPHSGIVINRDKHFVPDVVHIPGRKIPLGSEVKMPCRGKCRDKKCRKAAAKRRRNVCKKRFRSQSDVPYTTLGVSDGKPRARGTQKHLKDDDSLCGLDEIPRPEHVRIPPNLVRGTLQTHSLTVLPCNKEKKPDTVHYGILKGSFNMYDAKFGGRSRGRQGLTMSVMAYCLAFHYHPKQWTMKLLDNLVDAGDQWYLQCLEKVHDHSAVQGICEVLPFGKKQTLLLNKKKMQVLLGEPEIVGYTMSLDPTVYNLCRGLKAFFKENRAGIMLSRVLKVVIWKDKVCYYVFDPAGRDSRAFSNFASGQAAIMNVKDLDGVAELILTRSILEDQKYVLAPVKVLKMVDEKCDEDFESDKELTQAEKAMMGYRILNENCAIVNANMHLGDRCFEDAKFRQAIPIAIVAMTYAKISPPNTWFSKTLDKVLRLGNKLYMDCLHPKVMIDMTIDNIPNEIMVGPYACEIIIYRERVKGQLFTPKECLFNIERGLQEFFSHEYNSGILDFNNYALAVWRQKDMFYLFDPYPRTTDGLRTMKTGKACCLMVLNPETMAALFTKNWDYLPVTTQFYIHAFKVLKLKKKQPKLQILCTLSDEQLPGVKKPKRKVLPADKGFGDQGEIFHDVMPVETFEKRTEEGPQVDEEQLGDIISLVDSVQEDYLPPIPLRYKNAMDDPLPPKVVNLDSPTVSVTQVVPPWPKPRDKTNEVPDADPEREPTPPPTPPPLPPPEGAEEEEEVEEEEDEETAKRKKEEEEKRKAEEEEARRKAEELPPPLPPPPPSPQPEPEVPAFHATIDVIGEGVTWRLEEVLANKFFRKYDRGMVTTSTYSCAIFHRNGLYYLYDGSACNAMGLRQESGSGKACFMRFRNLHDLVSRIQFNRDGKKQDQQFILSRILVRRLLTETRYKLPEDYEYDKHRPKSKKSKPSVADAGVPRDKRPSIDEGITKSEPAIGYQQIDGVYRIEGTTSLTDRKPSTEVKPCHFVCLIAMLMATMHPIRTWDHVTVDTCIEKGLEIFQKATNLSVCEKRMIKNVIVDGKFININIKKIIVVNENPEKTLEQYLKAVLRRLRYVIVRFSSTSLVICQSEGYFHLFDPYPPPTEEPTCGPDCEPKGTQKKGNSVATWTLYRSMDALIRRIRKAVPGKQADEPEFYTFELTSVKTAPRHSALNYRLSPLFKPDENPNTPYLKRRKIRPIVDEKMYWLNIDTIPWSRMTGVNDLGFERKTPRAMWKDWDIEFPGDLFSLWGTIHPLDPIFPEESRGKQYLATCALALAMTQACHISGWTSSLLDGIVRGGQDYHTKCVQSIGQKPNYEIDLKDLGNKFDMFPFSFSIKFEKIIFGFVYNIHPDRFNLSKALVYFFEKEKLGMLVSPTKNLAFGKIDASYFMFDCQSYGAPIFSPGQGASYILKCESLNRLIYCMTLTLNIRRHDQQFHLFKATISVSEKSK